jgi:hypothetical protein
MESPLSEDKGPKKIVAEIVSAVENGNYHA